MIDEPVQRLDEGALCGFGRDLIPRVLTGTVAYAEAALRATNVAERDHLVRQAARSRQSHMDETSAVSHR